MYRLIRPALFRLDAERAHNTALHAASLCETWGAQLGIIPKPFTHPALQQQLWGIDFPNPVGLAAGFDKNARAPHVWPLCGFGFAELGTITAQAQPGNDQPRLFRLPKDHAVINRLGFNNDGAATVAERLHTLLEVGPFAIPTGINIGKSKAAPLDRAIDDYLMSLHLLFPFATYITINISSPNTPGLRTLQEKSQLMTLLQALVQENTALARHVGHPPKPLLVKIAPDLTEPQIDEIVSVSLEHGASGLIATNTTVQRDGIGTAPREGGGLSGAPLRHRATAVIRSLRQMAGPDFPIIGVGGIMDADDAYEKIRAGASLVQLYTGMIYHGPLLARQVAQGLVTRLHRDGFGNIREAVGFDVIHGAT